MPYAAFYLRERQPLSPVAHSHSSLFGFVGYSFCGFAAFLYPPIASTRLSQKNNNNPLFHANAAGYLLMFGLDQLLVLLLCLCCLAWRYCLQVLKPASLGGVIINVGDRTLARLNDEPIATKSDLVSRVLPRMRIGSKMTHELCPLFFSLGRVAARTTGRSRLGPRSGCHNHSHDAGHAAGRGRQTYHPHPGAAGPGDGAPVSHVSFALDHSSPCPRNRPLLTMSAQSFVASNPLQSLRLYSYLCKTPVAAPPSSASDC